jgi:LmbE family N-acetylglucosaminyl deacetylase
MYEKQSIALFLFAHQDDEFGVYQKILDEKNIGHRVCCAYLTDGASNEVPSKLRNLESLSVLHSLGVKESDIFFVGDELLISDSKLFENLNKASVWIRNWISLNPEISIIYVPAWEGGHHDHDVLHAITVSITEYLGNINMVKQFALYNNYKCPAPFFKVCSPLSLNGKVESTYFSRGARLKFLFYCLSYRSQIKTWVGLLPFVIFHYLFCGKQLLQAVSLERTYQRPHDGKLYYEFRGFSKWEVVEKSLTSWREWNNY